MGDNSDSPLLFEKTTGGIAWLKFNRPKVLNAIDMATRDELWSALLAVRDDPGIKVAVFEGVGERAFSAGADISEFGTSPSYIDARIARQERDVWGLMLQLQKPLVAAIHGVAFGAGCELALLCDIRIASEDARFALPEVALGYIPSAGGTQTLPRTIPLGIAREMILTGEPINAQRAVDVGLVSRVVSASRLHEEASVVAGKLAALSPDTIAAAKQAMLGGAGLSLEQALSFDALIAARLRALSRE